MNKINRGAEWEEAFLESVGYAQDNGVFKHISVARFASRTLDHELEKNTRTVVPYFSSTFILMAVFRYYILTCALTIRRIKINYVTFSV